VIDDLCLPDTLDTCLGEWANANVPPCSGSWSITTIMSQSLVYPPRLFWQITRMSVQFVIQTTLKTFGICCCCCWCYFAQVVSHFIFTLRKLKYGKKNLHTWNCSFAVGSLRRISQEQHLFISIKGKRKVTIWSL